MKKQLELKISGEVQGVGFRWSAQGKARELGLAGFAENRPDGSVCTVVEGEEGNLERFLAWCRRGPQFANVRKVDVQWNEAAGSFKEFQVL